jgi:hypothetical protein
MNFSDSGTVDTSPVDIVACASNARKAISCIEFKNPSAYTITVDHYNGESGTTVNIHSFILSAGDKLIIDNNIFLDPKDKLIATSSIAGTTYLVSGEEIDPLRR